MGVLLFEVVVYRLEELAAIAPESRVLTGNFRRQLLVNGLETTANLLRPTKPRCPHLGCALHWNEAEHSWDCSCHGSRFDQKGKVLNNPATGDMKHPPGPSHEPCGDSDHN